MLKILTVIGARPQFIKAAAVSRIIRQNPAISEYILHTGQHFDASMSAVFFDELAIQPPNTDLGLGGGSHGAMTGRQLEQIERVLLLEKPDWLLVYGDTNSTLAGALAAAKLHIPVAHVEAGLRSFNRQMPEEINRVVTDHVAERLYAPTDLAQANLIREGIDKANIRLCGDVMYDVARYYGDQATARSDILKRLELRPQDYFLVTIHRAENTDDRQCLRAICAGFRALAEHRQLVWPLHPRTLKALQQHGLYPPQGRRLQLIEPVGYLDMVQLERNASVIITDSGGVQKEAYFYRVPCVTLRTETEWQELVTSGWNRLLAPRQGDEIAAVVLAAEGSRGEPQSLYGDGRAANAIVSDLLS